MNETPSVQFARIRRWRRRHNDAISFGLVVLIAALVSVDAWKYKLISVSWLNERKDAFSAVNSITTTTLLIGGGIFSYYKFFKGRILSPKAELSLSISVHLPTSCSDFMLHAIMLTIKNVGSSTVWNPAPLVTIIIHGPEEAVQRGNKAVGHGPRHGKLSEYIRVSRP